MSRETVFTLVDSPIGPLCLTAFADGGAAIAGVCTNAEASARSQARWRQDPAPFAQAKRELAEYFAGARRTFEVPLQAGVSTPFQKRVWQALGTIPFGSTTTYGAIARQIGRPSAVRAVGVAIGRNPWGILVPCHRVVGASRALTGFAGGVSRKRWLLEHEGVRVMGGANAEDPRARAVISAS